MRALTTRDRAMIEARNADHAETYGTHRPTMPHIPWLLIASVLLSLFVISYAIAHILMGDSTCADILNSFNGGTDNPAAVSCVSAR